jgi:hypothetical protein
MDSFMDSQSVTSRRASRFMASQEHVESQQALQLAGRQPAASWPHVGLDPLMSLSNLDRLLPYPECLGCVKAGGV